MPGAKKRNARSGSSASDAPSPPIEHQSQKRRASDDAAITENKRSTKKARPQHVGDQQSEQAAALEQAPMQLEYGPDGLPIFSGDELLGEDELRTTHTANAEEVQMSAENGHVDDGDTGMPEGSPMQLHLPIPDKKAAYPRLRALFPPEDKVTPKAVSTPPLATSVLTPPQAPHGPSAPPPPRTLATRIVIETDLDEKRSHMIMASITLDDMIGWDLTTCGIRSIDEHKLNQLTPIMSNYQAAYRIWTASHPVVILRKSDLLANFTCSSDSNLWIKKKTTTSASLKGVHALLAEGNHRLLASIAARNSGCLPPLILKRKLNVRVYVPAKDDELEFIGSLKKSKPSTERCGLSAASLKCAHSLETQHLKRIDHEEISFFEKMETAVGIKELLFPTKNVVAWKELHKKACDEQWMSIDNNWAPASRAACMRADIRELIEPLRKNPKTSKLALYDFVIGRLERAYEKAGGRDKIIEYINALLSMNDVDSNKAKHESTRILKDFATKPPADTPGAKKKRESRAAKAAMEKAASSDFFGKLYKIPLFPDTFKYIDEDTIPAPEVATGDSSESDSDVDVEQVEDTDTSMDKTMTDEHKFIMRHFSDHSKRTLERTKLFILAVPSVDSLHMSNDLLSFTDALLNLNQIVILKDVGEGLELEKLAGLGTNVYADFFIHGATKMCMLYNKAVKKDLQSKYGGGAEATTNPIHITDLITYLKSLNITMNEKDISVINVAI